MSEEVPQTLADWCFKSQRHEDRLFQSINRIMGVPNVWKCNEPGFVWACTDCWVDGYDGSVEIIRGPEWPELTNEQAMAILDLGFGQIYESPSGAESYTDKGWNWTRNGRTECSARSRGDENVRMVKALATVATQAAALAAKDAEIALGKKYLDDALRGWELVKDALTAAEAEKAEVQAWAAKCEISQAAWQEKHAEELAKNDSLRTALADAEKARDEARREAVVWEARYNEAIKLARHHARSTPPPSPA